MVTIKIIESESDIKELDQLLWETLWRPIGLPRDVKKSFEISGSTVNFVAKSNGHIVGGLVAVWTSTSEVEIRHIAVANSSQKAGIGKKLIVSLSDTAFAQGCFRIHTISRNTSTGFFENMGFIKIPGAPLEHPAFMKHGIYFNRMEKATEPSVREDLATKQSSNHSQ